MSLLEQIIDSNNRGTDGDTDEFGIPFYDGHGEDVRLRPQYLVARALIRDRMRPQYDEYSTNCLHTRNGELWQVNTPIEETETNMYRLTGVEYSVPKPIQIKFWEELRNRAPIFSKRCIQVTKNIWWDMENCELLHCTYKELMEMLNNENT